MELAKSPLTTGTSAVARQVLHARARLYQGDEPDPTVVRPLILESWKRSRAAGVDPGWGSSPPRVPRTAKPAISHPADAVLERAAAPVFAFLAEALSDHPFLLMLTNRDCRPVTLAGTGTSLREGERINSAAAGTWREDLVGTDAVALCHAIGAPVQVHWYEHFAEVADPWTGNSCPVRDPATRAVVGTINLYAYGCISHPKAFELVTSAAAMIEQRLAHSEDARRARLLETFEQHVSRYPSDQTVCLTRQGIVVALANTSRDPLGIAHGAIRGRGLASIPGLYLPEALSNLEAIPSAQEVELRRGVDRVRADLRPVELDAEVAGFLLQLRPTATVRRRKETDGAWQATYTFADIVGDSASMRAAVKSAERAAGRDCTVLLSWESGTGKELFAHAIHRASGRKAGPFVAVNCGGLSAELLSAELFGYQEGAFTGASRGGRAGKLELADGGTLFLDEVEAMSPAMQVHLLRFLEDRKILRVGGQLPRVVDARIVAATNLDLKRLVEQDKFRLDLYYRLHVFPVEIPALRLRGHDVGELAARFLAAEHPDKSLHPDAIDALQRHGWPGNVRELHNAVTHAAIIADERVLRAAHFPSLLQQRDGDATAQPASDLQIAERNALASVLQRHRGSVGRAAQELGIHRVTLYRMLKRHRLDAR